MKDNALIGSVEIVVMDLKSIASDILRYIFEPVEWIRYIAIYFNPPSEYDTWPADKPPIYIQKSFISIDSIPSCVLYARYYVVAPVIGFM